ncbi:MAG: hypothetical protein LBO74_08025 [Candidatus Symbiothrix sp.]|jgi:hypothetical protein|nr:hypothetical protein [Candidatus Symbiothrix sp.]
MNFNENGVLNPGIYEMTWKDFHTFFLFSPRRKELLEGLKKVIDILQDVGCTIIYIDGSFVTEKIEPGDWDACVECPPSKIQDLYNKYPLFDKKEQKRLYKGELFDALSIADRNENNYISFFQQIRGKNIKKGIIKIKLDKQ